ncbi:MAG: lactonase family protein [Bacteroidota bacterium]|nr:MAG: lactonase family protein [Bacteroidota bacterium]
MKKKQPVFCHWLNRLVPLNLIAFLLPLLSCQNQPATYRVYLGTYTGQGSEGIYICLFNTETGQLTELKLAGLSENPSFLAIDKKGRFLYAVNETGNYLNESTGSVSAFAIRNKTGDLQLLKQISSMGAHPAHLSLSQTGQYLFVANYTGGNIAVYPIDANGQLAKPSAFVQHEGTGANPNRQEAPHAHCIASTNNDKFLLVADLGIDKLMLYHFDNTSGSVEPHNPAFIQLEPGAGPRHFAFHPKGEVIYVLNELNSTISVFSFDTITAGMHLKQQIATLPEDYSGENTTAEIEVDIAGRFLYASNRGHNSIVHYEIDPVSGELKTIDWIQSGGMAPRHFTIDPTGKWLLTANQDSDNVVVFRIDPDNGRLEKTSHSLQLSKPVCIRIMPIQ